MLTLPLEPTDDRANPAFKDSAGCTQWLGQLQLTNLHLAHGTLRTQLAELNRYPMRGLERLHVLELLRETVVSVQGDYAKKLIAKKLPLTEDEFSLFVAIIGLWQGMVTGYQRCLQDYMAGDAPLASHGALLCQRCLMYSGLQIFEYLRTGYEFDGKLWQQLHALYAFSETQDLQLKEVSDEPLGNAAKHARKPHGAGTSCSATYVKFLLLCHVRWEELSRQQLQLLDRWLTLWSATIAVERSYAASKEDAPPLAIDLSSAQGLQALWLISPSEHMRYLAMASLSKMLRVKIILLQQGQSPQQLELGEGCNSTDCGELLKLLHHCWCEAQDERLAERHEVTQQARMCYGMDGCFAYIANKPFKQPSKDSAVDTLSRKQIAAFGRVLSDTDRHDLAVLGFMLEVWQIKDESIRGVRLLRTESSGVRISHGQLVAVRPTSASSFMVGIVSWVKVTQSGQLHTGIRFLPGVPQAIAMKATGVNLTVSSQYVAALLLPAMPMLKAPASLIIPRHWFKPGRVVEIVQVGKEKLNVKLDFSVEKGSDFERVSFTEI